MCYVYSLKVVNIVKLEAILFMQIRWSKRQNSAWEPGKSNSAYPKYAKKSCSQLLLRNASRLLNMPLFQKWLVYNQNPGYAVATRTPTSNMYTFCGQTLTSVNSHCYLGIHLSNTLNWANQTKVASTKAQQTLGVIRRNVYKCPTHIKAVAYTSLVRPILSNIIICLGSMGPTQSK